MDGNFNIHLGKKLRMRRLSLGLTQTKVANAINVTFQQIQKYEKGTNGVSSIRLLQRITKDVPCSHYPISYEYDKLNMILLEQVINNIRMLNTVRLLKR